MSPRKASWAWTSFSVSEGRHYGRNESEETWREYLYSFQAFKRPAFREVAQETGGQRAGLSTVGFDRHTPSPPPQHLPKCPLFQAFDRQEPAGAYPNWGNYKVNILDRGSGGQENNRQRFGWPTGSICIGTAGLGQTGRHSYGEFPSSQTTCSLGRKKASSTNHSPHSRH